MQGNPGYPIKDCEESENKIKLYFNIIKAPIDNINLDTRSTLNSSFFNSYLLIKLIKFLFRKQHKLVIFVVNKFKSFIINKLFLLIIHFNYNKIYSSIN